MVRTRNRESPMDSPEFGAVFMANRATMEECLARRLFGLPSSLESFVKRVKFGMVLFLFQYEDRSLYGVFRAVSDGAMDIFPLAYAKRFPAQVRVEKLWDCEPLCEDEFRGAIRENYYQKFKFRFGLSQDQVEKLLWLFDSRRIKAPKLEDMPSERSIGRDTMEEKLAFQRKLSFEKFASPCKQSVSSPSGETIKGNNTHGSHCSRESRTSICPLGSESVSKDFGNQNGATVSQEGLEKVKAPWKEVGAHCDDFIPLGSLNSPDHDLGSHENYQTKPVAFKHTQKLEVDPSEAVTSGVGDFIPLCSVDSQEHDLEAIENDPGDFIPLPASPKNPDSPDLGDFIPLNSLDSQEHDLKASVNDHGDFIPLPASPQNPDYETKLLKNNQLECNPFKRYRPLRLISSECNNQSSDPSDNKADHHVHKGLYSDEVNRSSVIARLDFGSKDESWGTDRSTKEDKAVKQSYGSKKKSVFLRLSIASSVLQDVNTTLSDQHRYTVRETKFGPRDREDNSDPVTKGKDTVEDIMNTALKSLWWNKKTYADEEKRAAKKGKSVFSRLSWASQSAYKDNDRFSIQERSGYRREINHTQQWSETPNRKRTRDSKYSYEDEESFLNSVIGCKDNVNGIREPRFSFQERSGYQRESNRNQQRSETERRRGRDRMG